MEKRRHIYLTKKSKEEALTLFLNELSDDSDWPQEEIPVKDSFARVTSCAVYAIQSSPTANVSAMDGIVVRARDTFGASETTPVQLKIGTQARFINTGGVIPDGFDAVVMIEDIHQPQPDVLEIISAVPPYHHIRPIGEDIVNGEQILPSCHLIKAPDIGALLSGGLITVCVRKRPRVGIIPTGDEIVEPGICPKEGQVIESNSVMISSLIYSWGGEPIRYPIVKDLCNNLSKVVSSALQETDLLIIIAGSSAGSKDFTADVIAQMGKVVVHGVNIMPGKPVCLGIITKKPVIGLPGYPVSALIALEIFAKPVIKKMLHIPLATPQTIKGKSIRKLPSKLGQEEYIRVRIGNIKGEYLAAPLPRGAGLITSLVRADGILKVKADSEGVDAGQEVEIVLLKSKEEIDNAIIFIGSHDLSLDMLSDYLTRQKLGKTLSITHYGSLGGLMALKRGECHITGIHLLDPETGIYNIPYIKKYLSGKGVYRVHLAFREQGLIVKKGNPKKIKGLHELPNERISFVNRQFGSGTRLLLDHYLKMKNIDTSLLRDYEREVFTHMAVASLVKAGGADCGLGILGAARALDLDFIPIAKEEYDLVIPGEFFDLPAIKSIVDSIKSNEFKKELESLGGYDCKATGEIECLS